jgi:hypothetical protein
VLTWEISSSREEKVEWQPFHRQICPGRTTGAGGCAMYSGGVHGGCGSGVLKAEEIELVSDGDARAERVGEGPA